MLQILLYINPRYGDIAIMAKSKFFEKISCSTQESQVQETYNEMFKSVFKINTVDRKCQCDGYIDTRFADTDISMLIEYKYDIRMKDKIERARVIAQCVGYLHKFEESGMALPKLVFIGDINECMIIHTNDLLRLLDTENVDWSVAPCNLGQENNLIMPIVKSINPWVYDVDSNFKFDDIANKIINLCKGINQQVHITERNIEKVYNLFCDRVIKDKNKVQANDLVSTFIGTMLDSEHYYQHPRKKNILVANDKQVAINGDEFELFMQMHSTEYSPKEKRIMTAISDRLIEDTNRRNKGEFYTPTLFVDYAHKMIEKELGSHWKENYVVWDPAAGTLNLTRDYRFKELYCSTLEQAELDISKNYNKEATKFQFDFLNDSLDDLKVKAPGLLEAFELNRPIVFFLNPPYANGSGKGGVKGTCCGDSLSKEMIRLDGFKSGELLIQFLWRISYIKRSYNLSNCCVACFTNPTWLCGTLAEKFRAVWMNNFEYKSGVMFNAGEFANVSAQWGITFNIWKTGITYDRSNFNHILIESFDSKSQIREIGTKTLYNRDDTDYIPISVFVKSNNNIYKRSIQSLKISDLSLRSATQSVSTQKYLNAMITYHGDYIQNNSTCWIQSGYRAGNATFIDTSNFEKACLIFSIRKLIATNWILDTDSYIIRRNQIIPHEFQSDCVVYSVISCYGASLKQDSLICSNEFFWMSKQEMLDLAEKHNNDYTYEDALNSEERFVYLKLQEIKDDLSQEAKAVLDKATDLVKSSFKYREMFNESHPEYQINNWDCGFYQIKALLKEFMPDDLKEFRALYKQLADKMRPMIYELGFLK